MMIILFLFIKIIYKNSEFMINFDSKKIIKNLEKIKEENEMCKMEINL